MYSLLEIVFYGLFAAASAVILAAVFVVVQGARPRGNGIVFLAGFVLGTLLACVAGLVLGQAFVDRVESHDGLRAALTALLGLVLVVVGLRARRAPLEAPAERSSRTAVILAGLGNVGPAANFSMAGLLGFGGPKRLVLTFLAMGIVADQHYRNVVDVTLVALYLLVACLVVWVPVGLVVVAGDRAAELLAGGQAWLGTHAGPLRVWLALGIGSLLLVDGVARLLV